MCISLEVCSPSRRTTGEGGARPRGQTRGPSHFIPYPQQRQLINININDEFFLKKIVH